MKTRMLILFTVGLLLAAGVSALVASVTMRSAVTIDTPLGREIDLSPLDSMAVQTAGRVKSFDSFAHEIMGHITGPRNILVTNDKGEDAQLTDAFAYLDLMFRPELYHDVAIVYVKKKPMRATIARELVQSGLATDEEMETFVDGGLISIPMLASDPIRSIFDTWSTDLIRTAKFVNQVRSGASLTRPSVLQGEFRIIPPPHGDKTSPWFSVTDLFPRDHGEAALIQTAGGMDEKLAATLRNQFESFARSWIDGNASQANESLAAFCQTVQSINPEVYPSLEKLQWESVYFRLKNLTWVWLIYLISVVFLLMSVAYKWDGARWIGLGAFSGAFLLHTVALGLRWYVAGRWPNSNMFEAVTTSVWLGACGTIVIELLARKTPMRSTFVLSGAVASMAAMMSAHYIPQLDANIGNMMPVLHDLWLYIHTNVIIASYALIAMASVTAMLYLIHRAIGGPKDYARAGGASLLVDSAETSTKQVSFGQVMDGATMILMELSFLLLWAGIVMGAIWADHSWGRPWGWDPKEVFALNTWIIFLILVHVRLRAKDKGLWTAVLAVIGCGVMLFNWIIINFVITGLHSYA